MLFVDIVVAMMRRFLLQLPGMDVQPGTPTGLDGVADNNASWPSPGGLSWRGGPRGDAALGDRRQLERFGEGVQRRWASARRRSLVGRGCRRSQLPALPPGAAAVGVFSARCRASRLETTSQRFAGCRRKRRRRRQADSSSVRMRSPATASRIPAPRRGSPAPG